MNELTQFDNRKYSLTQTNAEFDESMTYDEWVKCGSMIGSVVRISPKWIVDWLNFGERKYGEMYAQALDATGLDIETLKKLNAVGKRIEKSHWHPLLTVSHHQEVMYLEPKEQDRLLELAEKNNWSKSRLREEVDGLNQVPIVPSEKCEICGCKITLAEKLGRILELEKIKCYQLAERKGNKYMEAFSVDGSYVLHSFICRGVKNAGTGKV